MRAVLFGVVGVLGCAAVTSADVMYPRNYVLVKRNDKPPQWYLDSKMTPAYWIICGRTLAETKHPPLVGDCPELHEYADSVQWHAMAEQAEQEPKNELFFACEALRAAVTGCNVEHGR